MLRTCVCPAVLLRAGGYLLLFAALSNPSSAQATPAGTTAGKGSSSTPTAIQSDLAAVQAMRGVLANSGGEAAWKGIRSAEESFSVLVGGETSPHVMLLLDDWSLDTTRYRRRVQGQTSAPGDHNGSPTFAFNTGNSQVAVPEFDQARTLAGRLPAAAAEVMLRRTEYVLKTSKAQPCKSGLICIDIFRVQNSTLPASPEQQWKISSATGLPVTIRYQTTTLGNVMAPLWREVYFLKYATEEDLVVPISIGMTLRGKPETWTFVSFKKSPGFDISQFDEEVVR